MSFPPSICLIGLILVAGCARSDRPHYAEEEWENDIRPLSESWDVRYTVTEAADRDGTSRPRLNMEAGYMASFEDDSTYTLLTAEDEDDESERVRAIIFDVAAGDTSAIVVARRIIYLDEDRRFEATGDVVVEGRDDRRMWSERLYWNERSQRVQAPGFVRIVTPRERIEGYNLHADEDLDNYTLERVTGEAEIEEDADEGL